MGRTMTSSKSNFSPGSTFSLSFLLAGVAASVAIVFALCISYHRKSSSKTPSSNAKKSNIPSMDAYLKSSLSPPPPPPAAAAKTEVQEECTRPTSLTSSPPRRKLSVSLSMRLPEGLSKIRANARGKGKQKVSQSADESSVWTKTIILGERCRIPSSDDEDEVAAYDHKGNKQRNYHPRTPRSLPVSRSNSFAIAESVPS